MLAKVRSADSAAQGVVVAVINRNFILIIGFLFLQNCSVDLKSTTPGAQSVTCSPNATQLSAFQPIMTNILQSTANVGAEQGCGNCHVSGIGAGSFKILAGATDAVTLANYCSATSRLGIIAVHPTQPAHAQVYTTADLAQLSAWVATF